ncbi:hypothetical protein CMUST_06095 [Corynebacterium mustelae]|uniref:DUF6891 domain-containing protein n=1 Tax=Corynebacterium mustelae TaxID=571915 RepID=A0A0G3GYB8_9CORY|nr:hypothetical protein [Corynebacterium mustelae]AKK05555.1 hypothetical protein CMUST_06095 [Corynebacterium mustelae]
MPAHTEIPEFVSAADVGTILGCTEEQAQDAINHCWRMITLGTSIDALTDDITYGTRNFTEAPSATQAAEAANYLVKARRLQIGRLRATGQLQPSRLSAAFNELREQEILALQNFTCCATCATAEAWDVMSAEPQWRGFVYFHNQDAESLINTNQTYIGYDIRLESWYSEAELTGFTRSERQAAYSNTCIRLANEILRPTFRAFNIGYKWNNNTDTRMLLSNCDYFAEI